MNMKGNISKNIQKDNFLNSQPLQTPVQSNAKTQYLDHYLQFMNQTNIIPFNDLEIQQNYGQQFHRHGIVYDCNKTHFNFNLNIIEESINSEVVVFQVNWGKFSTIFWVLNVNQESNCQNFKFAKGSFGRVYNFSLQTQDFVIKSIPIGIFNQNHIAKLMAIKELFLMKIAASLKVGPETKRWLGFDLIIYSNCVQFAMEKCTQIQCLTSSNIQTLKDNLYILHNFKVIHFDIKPENIMHSDTFKKLVFIDFGLSEIIKQERGFKSLYSFRGTLEYASQAMTLNFYENKSSFIDVYFNDSYCFSQTLSQLNEVSNIDCCLSVIQNIELMVQKQINQMQICKIILYRLKCYMFKGSINQLIKYFQFQKIRIHNFLIEEVIYFLSQIYPHQGLRCFYNQCIPAYLKQSFRFTYINQIYCSNLHFKNIIISKNKINIFHQFNQTLVANQYSSKTYYFDKVTLLALFTSAHTSSISKHAYIRAFLQFISFSNNIYEVNTKERAKVALIFRDRYFNELHFNQKQTNLAIVKTIIKQLFQQFAQTQQQIQINKINASQLSIIKDNIFNLLQTIFILKIGSCDEIIKWLQTLYNKEYLSNYDRMQLVIQASIITIGICLEVSKNNNYLFNLDRKFILIFEKVLNSNLNDENRDNISYEVNLWCNTKLHQIKISNDSAINWIADIIEFSIHQDKPVSQSLYKQQLWDFIPLKLKQLLAFQIHIQQIMYSKSAQALQAINAIYLLTPNKKKQKLYFFTFFIFHYFLEQVLNVQKCQQIIKIFQKNLKDEQLFNQLLLYPFMCFVFAKELFENSHTYLNNVNLLLNKLHFQIMQFHSQIIKTEQSYLNLSKQSVVECQLQKSRNLTFKKYKIVQ